MASFSISFAVMSRKFFVGGNWKMNGDKASIDGIVDFLAKGDLPANVGESTRV